MASSSAAPMDSSAPVNPSSLFSAQDLVVVLSGGATGLGLAMLSALVKTGASKVYILGRREAALQDAAKLIDPSGSIVVPVQCDVTDSASVKRVVEKVEKEVGWVDVLINNAGVTGPDHREVYAAKSIADVQDALLKDDADHWASAWAINSTAPLLVAAAFLGLLEKANERKGWQSGKMEAGGSARQRVVPQGADKSDLRTAQIITIASIAAFNKVLTLGLPYIGSKAAVVAMSKAMANFLGPWGIRSNLICPGLFPSEMTTGIPNEYPVDKIPAQRPGNYEEITGTLLYTVGRSGAYLNGNAQIIDGGRLLVMPGTY